MLVKPALMGVDVCGYLYVSDDSSSAAYRVNPTTGQVENLLDPPLNKYGHGMDGGMASTSGTISRSSPSPMAETTSSCRRSASRGWTTSSAP
jgi:hypothetical protein